MPLTAKLHEILGEIAPSEMIDELAGNGQAIDLTLEGLPEVSFEFVAEAEILILYGAVVDIPDNIEAAAIVLSQALELNRPGFLELGNLALYDGKLVLAETVDLGNIDAETFKEGFNEFMALTSELAQEFAEARTVDSGDGSTSAAPSGDAGPDAPSGGMPNNGWITV